MTTILAALRSASNAITEPTEISQSKARLFILVAFFAYFLITATPAWIVAGAFTAVASMWLLWVRVVPSVKYRTLISTVLDNTGISAVLFITGPGHPGLVLMYFWIVIGNGYRYNSKYSIYSMCLAMGTFWPVVLLSEQWQMCQICAAELTLGFVLISLFTYRLINNLEQAIVDAKSMKQKADLFKNKSMNDSLTGLCNRETAIKVLDNAVENNTQIGVLFIDLDNFKRFNDEYGHHVGDEVLINISEDLKRSVRDNDIVCRYAGDEFVVLVNDEDHLTVANVASRIHATMNVPTILQDGTELTVTCSIGAATLGIHGKDTRTILRNADTAMYMAKRLGRNQIAWYEEKIKE